MKNIQQIHLEFDLTVTKYCQILPNGLHSAYRWWCCYYKNISSSFQFHKYLDHIITICFFLNSWYSLVVMYFHHVVMADAPSPPNTEHQTLISAQRSWSPLDLTWIVETQRFISSFSFLVFGLINNLQICANLTSWSISSKNG